MPTQKLMPHLIRAISQTSAVLALVFITSYLVDSPPWMLGESEMLATFLFAGALAFVLVVSNLSFFSSQDVVLSVTRTITLAAVTCLPVVLILLVLSRYGLLGLPRVSVPITALLILLVLYFGFTIVNKLPMRNIALLAINVGLLVISVVPSTTEYARSGLADALEGIRGIDANPTTYVFSSLHDIRLTEHVISPVTDVTKGGALNVIDDNHLLLVTAGGKVRLLNIDGEKLQVLPEYWDTPFDVEAYHNATSDPSPWFRVTDALLEPYANSQHRLYVSYQHWDGENSCNTLKLAEAIIDTKNFGKSSLEWTERFTSRPCLSGKLVNLHGGRIARLGEETLLLTVGVHLYDENALKTDFEQLASTSYGKIIAIDKNDWSSRIYSRGHRNPQGLLVLEDGSIWSTEHGPQGGDELNLIIQDADYGWPKATYGTDYGSKRWPLNNTPGDHNFGRRPVYAWVPSLGVSNLISIKGVEFPSWRGDLIVGSLTGLNTGRSLYRVKLAKNRVVVSERIPVGRPVRDLVELVDGRLALWDGESTIQLMESASIVFSACSGCHALHGQQWAVNGIGPDLMGIVGAKVARDPNYPYSKQMKAYGGKWTRQRLDKFLQDPSGAVPGTTMNISGIPDSDEREALIDYLENLNFQRKVQD